MIGVDHWYHLILVVAGAILAMLAFAAGTQGYFLVKSRIWETAALILVALILFRPGIVWDKVFPPLHEESPTQLVEWVGDMAPGAALRIKLKGERLSGKSFTKTIMLTMGDEATGAEKLAGAGFEIRDEEGRIFIDNVMFSSPAEKAGIDFDQEILNLQIPTHRMPKELMYFPAMALYALVWIIQNRRRKQQQPVVAT
jgi:hypothetical protein